jgi:DNA topoisomerase-1
MRREKVLAAVVRLLETTLIRVGNDEYAQQNRSFGLTTLRNRHAKVRGSEITFNSRQNGEGAPDQPEGTAARKAGAALPGPAGPGAFRLCGQFGTVRDVTSEDVNAYLREIAGADFTAKDFRTWAGRYSRRGATRVRHFYLQARGEAQHHSGDRGCIENARQHRGDLS